MALGKRLFTEGAAACLTETTDIFGGSTGKALYSMDYDASDASGSYNATPTNIDFGVSGKTVNGARFNGSSSEIGLPVGLGASGDRAFSFWMKLIALPTSGTDTIIYIGNQSQNSQYTTINVNSSGTVRYQERHNTTGGDSTNDLLIESSTNISINQWVHIVIVFDGTTRNFYLNGSTSNGGTGTKVGGAADTSSFAGQFGSFRGVGGTFTLDGTIDQARFFSTKITPTQVATLYNSGNGEIACVHTATTTDVDYPTTNIAYYKLDNSAVDSHSGTYDGTETNIEYRFGRFGQAAVFNGSSSYIDTGGNLVNSLTSITVSGWFYTDANTNYSYGLQFGTDGSSGDAIAIARWNNTASGGFDAHTLYVRDGSQSIDGNYVLNENTWYHITITWTGTTIKFYVNGNLETTATASASLSIPASGNSGYIGRYIVNQSFNWKGKIDQVRIFSTVLDSDQVSQLYNEKPETDTSNFKAVLYKGTGATQYISNVGMDLETSGGLVWIKNRDQEDSHALVDNVRGIATTGSNYIASDATTQEASSTNMPSSLEKNGFFVQGSGGRTNTSSEDYVAWVFKAGGAATGNSVGDIASQVSLNSTLGFSIVSYTGDANQSNTIGHGLKIGTTETRPDLIIVKNRTATNNPSMMVWSSVFSSSSEGLLLNSNVLSNAITDRFGTITTTTFKGGTNGNNEVNGANTMIAYCFASVTGLSKISSYNGDSSSNLGVSSVGFKPSLLVIKKFSGSGTGHWMVYDNRRDTTNAPQTDTCLFWNLDDQDFSASDINVRFDSNGFTILGNNSNINGAGNSYLYIAFK